jgi:hypothetical protein
VQIPIDYWNISLWLAVTAITTLITAQLVSAYDGPATLLISAKRLKYAALTMSLLFLATLAIRIFGMITST